MNVLNRLALVAKPVVHNVIVRNLRSDLKITWKRPEKIASIHPQKSGDLSPVAKVDETSLIYEYDRCKELQE